MGNQSPGTHNLPPQLLAVADDGNFDTGATGIKADIIAESTSANGVAVDGVTLKDGSIVTADGGSIQVDTIDEATAANGVTVDSVVMKDGGITVTANIILGDGDNIAIGTGAGTTIGLLSTAKISFYGVSGVVRAAAPTAVGSTIVNSTIGGSGSPNINALTATGGWGFAATSEGGQLIATILNTQTRVGEIVTALQGVGIIK